MGSMQSVALIERSITYANLVFDAVWLACNLFSLSYFIKRREELGNALLAYLNIADSIVCLSDMTFQTLSVAQRSKDTVGQSTIVVMALAVQMARCSITLTGIITIYLNILRTSVIIWPMVQFRKRLLHASLIVLTVTLIIMDTAFGIFYTYPWLNYQIKSLSGIEASPPYETDHPLHFFVNNELQIFGVPIAVVIVICCIASTAKLLTSDVDLHGADHGGARRRRAAVTVLILSVQYAVLNASGLITFTLGSHYQKKKVYDPQIKVADQLLIKCGVLAIILNSTLNPILYVWRVKKLREYLIKSARRISRK